MEALCNSSVLFVTLDSCRYDTFAASHTPNLDAIGPLHRAKSPAHFTLASHTAMFAGFTPGVAEARESFINPKFGKIFKLDKIGAGSFGENHITVEGRNIVEGFGRAGFETFGTGAVGWFDPTTRAGTLLSRDFQEFYYPGNTYSINKQVAWLIEQIKNAASRASATSLRRPVFAFLNVGETHVPYYHEGAPWDVNDHPCQPFGESNDADKCRERQRACLEYSDQALAPLLELFRESTVVVCGDHGDAWGEDGIWEHTVFHPVIFDVPLMFRLVKGDWVNEVAESAEANGVAEVAETAEVATASGVSGAWQHWKRTSKTADRLRQWKRNSALVDRARRLKNRLG